VGFVSAGGLQYISQILPLRAFALVWPSDRLFRALVWFTTLVAALTLVRLASLAGLEISRNYNEGWNAYHALAAMGGGALYPRPPSLFINNYPPLSFFVAGAIGKLTGGDLIVVGRILSLLNTLVASWAVFAIARALRTTRIEALFAASLFLAKLLAASNYVGINDPQMLGHALGCLGFLAVVAGPRTQRSLVLGALLLTLAVFVKHMLVIQPIALVIWLAIYDWRAALRLVVFGLLFGLVGLLLSRIALGVDLVQMLFTARTYRLDWIEQSLWDFLLVSFAPLGAGLALLFSRDKHGVLCGLYTVLAVIIGLGFDGGAGVGRNALFDAAIGGALSAGLLAHHLYRRARPLPLLFALACLVPPGIAVLQKAEPAWLTEDFWLKPMAASAQDASADIAFIRQQPGPAMCEKLSFCFWAGKKAQVDAFNWIEAVRAGKRDERDLVRLIDARYFSTVELGVQPRIDALPAVKAALARNYRTHNANGYGSILIPREPAL
jgi:hypothetical protein